MRGASANKEEELIRDYYDRYGWTTANGISGEDALFRDFSPPYYPYQDAVNARTLTYLAGLGHKLLIAGGGDLPETHLCLARRFSQTTCLDISKVAIEIARSKLGRQAEFILGSLLKIPRPDNYFDAVYCAHVIYHIGEDQQERAVRELIRVTRPGGRIAVIYANPHSLPNHLVKVKGRLPLLRNMRRKRIRRRPELGHGPPYYFAHPLTWWARFNDECEVEVRPWVVMSNTEEESILLRDGIAALAYRLCAWLESQYPHRAAQWWSYPLFLLTKRPGGKE